MRIGHICYNCKKHFYRDSTEKEIKLKKGIYCSEQCRDEVLHEINNFRNSLKFDNYAPPYH
jgi:hypothetical protein